MERKIWLDNVRALSCFMVVVVHVTALTKYSIGNVSNALWGFTVIIDSASRMCVPLFLRISGYIFLNDKSVRPSNIIKIFTALVFYSLLCVAYYSVFGGVNFIDTLKTIYQKPAMYHLWYLYYIFVYYVLFFFIKVRNLNPKHGLIAVTIAMIIFNPTLNDVFYFTFGVELKNGFAIDSQYLLLLLYCFSGAFVGSMTREEVLIKSSIVICITSIALISYMTIIKSIEIGSLAYQYQNYITIPVYMSSISAFYIVKNINLNSSSQKVISFISDKSLAIYGVHAIILEYVKFKKLYFFDSQFANLIVTFVIVIISSTVTATIIRTLDKRRYVS
ncbi:acyltransferase family protein [Enterobacter asburiae]|nr:acyltransferase family protein [Enterobacter asburiae]HED1212890.1 acyltransferase family protein [Enterobacter asburiae]